MEFFIQNPQKGVGSKKVKMSSREMIEPEEVFLDNLAQKKEEEFGISEKKFEVPLSQKILKGLYFLCLFLILILFAKSFYFQIVQGKDLLRKAKDNAERFIFERSDRGVIYDSKGELLVSNIPSFDLVLDRRDLPQDENEKLRVLETVAKIIKQEPEVLESQIKQSAFPVILISENLSHETLLVLEPKIQELPGFYVEKNTVRNYKSGPSFAHLLGFVGKVNSQELKDYEGYSITDYIGKSGLEKSYEQILRGKPGIVMIEKDTLGQKRKEEKMSLPEAGKSLKLYLDAGLQRKTEEALVRTLSNVGSTRGVVVALDPKTGGVLAMVSIPSFNNNLFSQGISQEELDKINQNPLKPLFNRAISGKYVVGSTIKPLMGVAGLEEGVITPDTKINDFEGKLCIKNQWDSSKEQCYGAVKPCGVMDIYKAIAESCNVYFYTLGGGYEDFKGLGIERIEKWLKLFGWGKPTGIDLSGESEGLIPDPDWKKENFAQEVEKKWYLGDTYNLSIGQGFIQVTPLQVVSAFVAIANGGKLYQPQVVKEILDNEKNIVAVSGPLRPRSEASEPRPSGREEIRPQVVKENLASRDDIDVIRESMREGVLYGSSVILNSLPVTSAAKTGTAQTPKQNVYHNWVTVFAPYENPQIVLTVMLESVPGVQAAALPVAKEVLEWYFRSETNF